MLRVLKTFARVDSIKSKLLLFVLVPVIVFFAVASVVSYYIADAAMIKNVNSLMINDASYRAGNVEMELVRGKETIQTIANVLATDVTDADAESLFKRVQKSTEIIDHVGVAYADKRFIKSADTNMPPGYDPTIRPWYKNAASNPDKVLVTNAYISQTTGKMIVTITKAVVRNGAVVGVAAIEVNLDAVKKLVLETKIAKTGYGLILDSTGMFVIDPTRQAGDYIQKVDNGALEPLYNQLMASPSGTIVRFVDNGVLKSYCVVAIKGTPLSFISNAPTQEFYEDLVTMRNYSIGIGAVTIVLLGLIIVLFAARISKPLNALSNTMHEMAQGNLIVNIRELEINTNDEVGRLAKSCSEMAQNIRGLLCQVSQATEQLGASSEELTASAEQSAQAASQVARVIAEVASGAEQQLKAVDDTSIVVHHMSGNVQHIADNTNTVVDTSARSANAAQQGSKAVEKAIIQMSNIEGTVIRSAEVISKLGERSKEIGQIVDTISGIAGQTNLLALNAAIEAARAGEQGRGFAVVAEEVRKLAEQSQEAAKQIAGLISEIQQDTDSAVAAMNEGTKEVRVGTEVVNDASQTFKEIFGLVNEVSTQVGEISSAIQQMASGSQQIVTSMREIDTISKGTSDQAQTISAATEEQAASMQEIATSSQALAKMAEQLAIVVNKFTI